MSDVGLLEPESLRGVGWGDGEETEWKGKWVERCEWRAVNKTVMHVDETQRTHVWRMGLDVKYS